VVFKGGILGGACQFWGNTYLNSAAILFDNYHEAWLSFRLSPSDFATKKCDATINEILFQKNL